MLLPFRTRDGWRPPTEAEVETFKQTMAEAAEYLYGPDPEPDPDEGTELCETCGVRVPLAGRPMFQEVDEAEGWTKFWLELECGHFLRVSYFRTSDYSSLS